MSTERAALARFTRTSQLAANEVISEYSTSFGLATKLLGARHRQHVRNIYALVRVADEIVDGVAAAAGLAVAEQAAALDRYETETHRAMATGYSSDLVVHAFAQTARLAGITETLTQPFFASMRADLNLDQADLASVGADDARTAGAAPVDQGDTVTPQVYDAAAHAQYVHGSAEVVGLMCLRVFLRDESLTAAQCEVVERGASQLGAAFQNVNFLRDLADDTDRLGRSYLGTASRMSEGMKMTWVGTVREQLDDAAATIPLLPRDARAAVRSALELFAELTRRVQSTPVNELYERRVRVPDAKKLWIAAAAVARTAKESRA